MLDIEILRLDWFRGPVYQAPRGKLSVNPSTSPNRLYDPLEYRRWCIVDLLGMPEGLLPVHGLCRPAQSVAAPLLLAVPGRGGFWIHRWGNNPVAGPSRDSLGHGFSQQPGHLAQWGRRRR